MKKERKPKQKIRVRTAAGLRVFLLAAGIWLLLSAALVVTTAERFYERMYQTATGGTYGNLTSWSSWVREKISSRMMERSPDYFTYLLLEGIQMGSDSWFSSLAAYGSDASRDGQYSLLRYLQIPVEYASVLYDGDGKRLFGTDDRLIVLAYETQGEYLGDGGAHYGWMDISEGRDAADPKDDPFAAIRPHDRQELQDLCYFSWWKITCALDGEQIIPYRIEKVDYTKWIEYYRDDDFTEVAGKIDASEWKTILDRTEEYDGTRPLQTIYSSSRFMWLPEEKELDYQGEHFASLAEYVSSETVRERLEIPSLIYSADKTGSLGRKSLAELLVFRVINFTDTAVPPEGEQPRILYTLVNAYRAYPLKTALLALYPLLGVSLAIVLIAAAAVWATLKKRLVGPAETLASSMAGGWTRGEFYLDEPVGWRETDTLIREYEKEAEDRWRTREELSRTKKALEYASEAETRRREMLSMMAHELKTPLAVVHSYAEGLREHIAEDKKEQYLETIVGETEKMDAIVLEMLDYSRLEAGRVKLSRDEFSLTEAVRASLRKLQPFAEEKHLTVEETCPEDLRIAADEARTLQVLDNLIGNAVRYTPENGKIRISAGRRGKKAFFRIENTGRQFSEEELRRVFETFYRADPSGNTRGTGLGLAIVKQITELHGGSCRAENTADGVAFTVEMPA